MIKKWLGIREMESNLKQLKVFMKNYSEHAKNLYNNHNYHNNRLSNLEGNHKKLHEMDRKMESMFTMMEKIVQRMEEMEPIYEVVEQPQAVYEKTPEIVEEVAETIYESPVKTEIFVGDKDKILLQILHQNAAIDETNSIPTKRIFDNLPFNITQRGLRKKLTSLESQGIISSKKEGKKRSWHVKTGELARVKELLTEPRKKKRNRN